ncbi:YafY family transcriptional regulator [Silicimonas algicola]|uniref:WYL domain-containing protein n=1 Tax=Silicimonas algicola TaxID=1826607 RepID=A0A316G1Q5_9RHOB|nr:YafY family protein [Silicimonas algicola]AZQ65773.1 YafY family transcriptional regulator [Silicimonas algicola]PWK54851.1 WYL domain-containing protein [Silicimonas algicola]
MPRTDRLFTLLQTLRTLPQPVTAARLAEETDVSRRTLYRDIESLRAAGAVIDGEPGFGYRLTEDPAMPPQLLDRIEVEALVLGLAEVEASGDPALASAARSALSKITARLPERVAREAAHAVSLVYRYEKAPPPPGCLPVLRGASWDETALDLDYRDADGTPTQRRVLPLAVVFLENTQVLLAWCCLREDFRKFRLDRIETAKATGQSFRPRRVPLLREYIARLRSGG